MRKSSAAIGRFKWTECVAQSGIFHFGQVSQQFAILDRHLLRAAMTSSGMEVVQVIHQHDIGPAARGNHPDLATDAKMLGGVEGGHLEGRHRGKALPDGMPQDAVHVAFIDQRGGMTIVGAQDEMARVQVHVR